MEKYHGKTAIVTGASAGIGATICKYLVENAGMIVLGVARRANKVEELAKTLDSKTGKLVAVKCDITKDNELLDLYATANKQYGGVLVCVNNAGGVGTNSLVDGNSDEWRDLMNLNVISHSLSTKLAIKSMEEHGKDGYIFNIGSRLSLNYRQEGITHFYSVTKFALRALTDCFRMELKQRNSGIKIASIHPGMVHTELIDEVQKKQQFDSSNALHSDEVAQTILHALTLPARAEITDIMLLPTRN